MSDLEPRLGALRFTVQVYVSALRKTLVEAGAGDRLISRPGGHLLRPADSEPDSLQPQQRNDQP